MNPRPRRRKPGKPRASQAATGCRWLAFQVIRQVLEKGHTLDQAMAACLPEDLSGRDRALVQKLAFDSLRWRRPLEWFQKQLLRQPLKARDADIGLVLLLGLAQLWPEPMAEHAVVNETVDLTRQLDKPWARGLVNAVLRNFQRQREELQARLAEAGDISLAHPGWLLERYRKDWPERWRALAEAGNRQAPLWLRVNLQRISMDDYRQALEAAGIGYHSDPLAPAGLRLEEVVPVAKLPGYAEGWFSVQDLAAQQASRWLAAEAGMRVLDACAAPGGKTAAILEHSPGLAAMVAIDNSENRLQRMRANLQRLGHECELLCADAASPRDWWDGQPFDRILLDAPCSGTGVIRRHPDIKWLRSEDQVHALQQTQSQLLSALWPLLRPGGRLVYATCSVLKSENHERVRAFLEQTADAMALPVSEPGIDADPGRQWLPDEHDSDGFYYAALERQA